MIQLPGSTQQIMDASVHSIRVILERFLQIFAIVALSSSHDGKDHLLSICIDRGLYHRGEFNVSCADSERILRFD